MSIISQLTQQRKWEKIVWLILLLIHKSSKGLKFQTQNDIISFSSKIMKLRDCFFCNLQVMTAALHALQNMSHT
jgi:hypothetical protein